MDDLTTKIVAPGSAGILGMVIGWFGLKGRISRVEKSICNLKKEIRYEITCDKIHLALDKRLETIEALHTETRNDIREILRMVSK